MFDRIHARSFSDGGGYLHFPTHLHVYVSAGVFVDFKTMVCHFL